MDHSWRPHLPPPPIQGRICPSCSVSHFPFCPPFPPNPSFPYPPPPPPHQPLPPPPPPPQAAAYDPFVDHRGGPLLPPHPRNPSFDYNNNVGVNKRMRIDDSPGQFMNGNSTNLGRFPTDDDRRLKLINEFGGSGYELGTGYGSFDGGRSSNSSYIDPGHGNFDRKQMYHDKEHFLRQQYPLREGNVQFGQLGYDEFDNNLSRKNGYNEDHHQPNYHEGSRYILPRRGVSGTNKRYHEQINSVPVDDCGYSSHYSEAYAMQNHAESKANHYGLPYDQRVNSVDRNAMSLYTAQGDNTFASQPPLPASPPPPLPMEPRERFVSSSPPGISASVFPGSGGSSAPRSSSYPPLPEDKSISCYQGSYHMSSRSTVEEINMHHYTSSSISSRGSEHPQRDLPSDKSKVIDASHILKHPYRASRPDHLVIILRGLPGSGKSYLAKILRDLEVENGGTAPRIHSMDDYFMTEVEKVEESEVSKSSGSIRGKKMVKKQVMEYCYEPEMEEAYRSSMLKAFKKTLDEGAFSFVIEIWL